MKALLCVIVLLLAGGCSSTPEVADLTLPALIYQAPFPPFPYPVTAPDVRIELNILIDEQGAVRYVDLLRGSGSTEWDSSARAAVFRWRYSPAQYKGKSLKLWLHQSAVVQFAQPNYMTLAELYCATQEEADSVYRKLTEGCDFCEMVLLHSVAPSRDQRGTVGRVNIQQYPEEIRRILSRLEGEEWTEPVKYGEWYAIFKRVDDR
ncbi:MAG: TonB family protein [Bacteroidetes bacterium]|nr:MAG: TonB family protein [Bacteroidota bacterium]